MSETDGTPEQDERLEKITKLLSLAYAMISVLWLLWILIPEHRRRLLMMHAAASLRQTAGRLACRTGHQAMGLELRVSVENYELPYRLSLVREWAAKVYEKLRYTA